MEKVSRSKQMKEDIVNEIGFRDKNKNSRTELKDKIGDSRNNLNRYNSC